MTLGRPFPVFPVGKMTSHSVPPRLAALVRVPIRLAGRLRWSAMQVDGTQSMSEVFESIDKHLVKLAENENHALAA